jgi:hypothetical protein
MKESNKREGKDAEVTTLHDASRSIIDTELVFIEEEAVVSRPTGASPAQSLALLVICLNVAFIAGASTLLIPHEAFPLKVVIVVAIFQCNITGLAYCLLSDIKLWSNLCVAIASGVSVGLSSAGKR